MKSKKNLVFLGMMGSGKSSIGYLVSKRLKLNFIDIDHEIENELGTTIKKIFTTRGENYFRTVEEKITLKKLQLRNAIISLGGGAFVNKKIQKEVLKNHISFWLKVNDETIIKRVKNSEKRPIALKATNHELIELIKKRSYIYSRALYKIKCDNITKKKIVDKILNIYETN